MNRQVMHGALFVVAVVALGACTTVHDFLGVDSGHVQVSCAASGPLPGAPPLQTSLSPLTPGTTIEILRAAPRGKVMFTLPAAESGDDFSYAWDESAASGGSPGMWQCHAEWSYDGKFWRLQHLDSRWVGGAAQK